MATNHPLPDIDTVIRAAQAKERAATRKMAQSKHLYKQAQELEREAASDMAEVEAFKRLLRGIAGSQTDEEMSVEAQHERNMLAQGVHVVQTLDGAKYFVPNGNRHLDPSDFRTQRDKIAAACFQILSDGSWKSTEELLEELTRREVRLTAENKLQRLSQILSMNRQFKNERGRGWALDLSPARGESLRNSNDESEPEKDARLLARARELTRDDGNSAR